MERLELLGALADQMLLEAQVVPAERWAQVARHTREGSLLLIRERLSIFHMRREMLIQRAERWELQVLEAQVEQVESLLPP